MPANEKYDVVLDGQGYLIDPESYRGRQKTPFAPKTSQGDTGYGDLLGSSAWARTSFRGGFGYPDFDSAHPDRFADGTAIDSSFGDLRAGRALTSSLASVDIAAFAAFGGFLYGAARSSDQVQRTANGIAWALAANVNVGTGGTATGLASMWMAFTELLVGSGNNGQIFSYDGTTWRLSLDVPSATAITAGIIQTLSVTGGPPTANNISLFGASGLAMSVVSSAACTLFQLTTTAGAVAITYAPLLTLPYQRIDALAIIGDRLYIGASTDDSGGGVRGALYAVDGLINVTPPATNVRLLPVQAIRDNGIAAFGVYKGEILAGSRTKGLIWKVGAAGLEEFFRVPEIALTGTPAAYTSPIRSLVVDDEKLYIPIADAAGNCLYQFDGTGWCRFTTVINPSPAGAGVPGPLAAYAGMLHYGIGVATAFGIYRAPPGYATTATLITSWFDGGLADVDKGLTQFTMTHSALTAGQSLTAEYQLDNETTWHLLGTSNTVGASEITFQFPAGVVGNRIRGRYTLTGSTAASPLKLRSTVVSFQLAPDVKREWSWAALLCGVPGKELIRYDETIEPLKGSELSDALWTSRLKKTQLTFQDIDKATYTVWFSDLTEEIDRGRPRAELATRGLVRLEEA